MGVYRPKRRDKETGALRETPFFHFDFTIGGRRFHGSTGQTSKRDAEAFERRKRQEVATGAIDISKDESFTLSQAARLYWDDIAIHRRSKSGIDREIKIVLAIVGAKKKVVDVRTADVQRLINKRRQGGYEHTSPNPSPATINRTLEVLRAILRHFEETKEIALPKIGWRRLMLSEPKPPERTFSPDELQRWADELPALERFFLIALATYGPRFGELFMPPESIDVSNPARPIMRLGKYEGREDRDVRKDGTLLDVVLLPEDAAIFAGLAVRARKIKSNIIWVEETAAGELSPVRYYAMRKRLREAAARAGVKADRLIHSLRHHAATALVSQSNDIVLARKLLGHSSITTTQRYAHADESRLMDALATISRNGPERRLLTGLAQTSKVVNNQPDMSDENMVPPPGLEPGTDAGDGDA